MRRVAMGRISEIWEGDRLIQDFGMKLLEAREGYAKVSVEVRGRFLNAHGIGHGVLIFAVADAAFALSVNAVPRGEAGRGGDRGVEDHSQGSAVDGLRTHGHRRGRQDPRSGAVHRSSRRAGDA
jgi:acyl-CoA thioesterase